MVREALLTVEGNATALRLDVYLQRRLGGISRERAQEIIRGELRTTDGTSLKPSSLVRPGLQFILYREMRQEEAPPVVPIAYEDEAVVVVDKPAGLAVHPAGRHYKCTLTAVLAARGGIRPDPAHRLDRETSGLLVCGIGRDATASLKRAFADGEVQKTYLAVVHGWPSERRFCIDLPLELGTGLVRVRMRVGSGKPAITDVEVRRCFVGPSGARYAVVACSPRTGRQHQIRAHLSAAGHAVVGDKIYGPDETIFIRFTEGAMTDGDRQLLLLPRHALHAHELALSHPREDRRLLVRSPLPSDLERFLELLCPVESLYSGAPPSESSAQRRTSAAPGHLVAS